MKRFLAIVVAGAFTSTLGCSDDAPETGAPAVMQANALTASIDVPLLADTRMEESSPDSNYATVNVWGSGTTGRSTRSLLRLHLSKHGAAHRLPSRRAANGLSDHEMVISEIDVP
jgi:hypothetical protein